MIGRCNLLSHLPSDNLCTTIVTVNISYETNQPLYLILSDKSYLYFYS